MSGMDNTIIDRIPFGGIRDLEMHYEEDDMELMAERQKLEEEVEKADRVENQEFSSVS